MVTYRQRVREIERRLAGRRLVYFGTRGTDARPLLEISNFEEVFSQIAPLEAAGIQETCLETLKKERVDLDRYSIDQDPSPLVNEVRRDLLRAFSRPAAVIPYRPSAVLASACFTRGNLVKRAVIPYRPSAVLASACFTRGNLVKYMGLFHEFQACFEHKPWIETQLSEVGIRVVPWRYFADDDFALVREAAEAGPIVLRTTRSDGGAGLTLVQDPSQLHRGWPEHHEGFLAVAPFMKPSIPLNVNACVFLDGEVSLHAPSLQLIGIPTCTDRSFGYCGNDFGTIGALDVTILQDLERIVVLTGRWLSKQGYRGTFGVDALVHEGMVYLVEVNPRFQGSSVLAAAIARQMERPDLFLDHMAAFLDLQAPLSMPLVEQARTQPNLAHVVCHNLLNRPARVMGDFPSTSQVPWSLVPSPDVSIAPGAIMTVGTFSSRVTETGFELEEHAAKPVEELLQKFQPPSQEQMALNLAS